MHQSISIILAPVRKIPWVIMNFHHLATWHRVVRHAFPEVHRQIDVGSKALDHQYAISVSTTRRTNSIDKCLVIAAKNRCLTCSVSTGLVGASKHDMLVKVAQLRGNLLPVGFLFGVGTDFTVLVNITLQPT